MFATRRLTAGSALAVTLTLAASAHAATVIDDTGKPVALDRPAARIISLAPHATEILYAAGAGDRLIAVSDFSDYPPQVRKLPSIGGTAALDVERIATLRPDLVLAWSSGNSATQVAKLRKLGLTIFESEPRSFDDIASNIERIGKLAGTQKQAAKAAADFRQRAAAIAATYRDRAPVTVFYQVWREPLMSLNGKHLVSQAIRMCGGRNIFADLPQLAPTVGLESVLRADPEVILATSGKNSVDASWRQYAKLTAVARDNLYAIDADWLARPGPRILDGTEALCRALDAARNKRPK